MDNITIQQVLSQVEDLKHLFEAGSLTEDEFRELLEDIKNTHDIESMSEDMKLKGQLITALDIATYLI